MIKRIKNAQLAMSGLTAAKKVQAGRNLINSISPQQYEFFRKAVEITIESSIMANEAGRTYCSEN